MHPNVFETFCYSEKLKAAYNSVLKRIGNPLDETTLYSPLHNQQAINIFEVYQIIYQ